MIGQTSRISGQKSSATPGLTVLLFSLVVCYSIISHVFQRKAVSREEAELDDNMSDGACAFSPGAAGGSSLCMEAQLFQGWDEMPRESHADLDHLLVETPAASTVSPASGNLQVSTAVPSEAAAAPAEKKQEGRMRGSVKMQDHKSKPTVSFAQSLMELQENLEAKMQASARRHAEHRALRALTHASHGSAEEAHAGTEPEDNLTPWAHNLDDLTHSLQDHMKARNKARAEHAATRALHAAELKAGLREPAPKKDTHELLADIESLGKQLCQSPERRNSPACAHFTHSEHHVHTSAEERHADVTAHLKLLEKHMEELHKEQQHDSEELKSESMEFLKVMCSDPARSSYPACARFHATPKGSFLGKAAPVAAVNEGKLAPSSMKMLVHRKDVGHYHLDGKVPKVACITVLPQGHATEILMKYFMDNYKLQHYEGEKQLIIIYHDHDAESSRIAHLHADGTSVIAKAALGNDVFPSATAYRYGAWLAKDADLVARWDFDAWHHPHRLSMQVRAMNLVQRPVSMIARITAFDAEENQFVMPGGTGHRGSMIGKAAWMHKHWMPLLEEENQVPLGLHGHHVVQVDMPELLAYHDVPTSDVPPEGLMA